jgi:CrcB protein
MLLAVFVAGAGGAASRYLLDGIVQDRWTGAFPMGTFVVNMAGSFALGVVAGFATAHADAPAAIRVAGGTGFVGAFTTFSTLAWESMRLLREGATRHALGNLLGSTAAGLALAGAGLFLGSLL